MKTIVIALIIGFVLVEPQTICSDGKKRRIPKEFSQLDNQPKKKFRKTKKGNGSEIQNSEQTTDQSNFLFYQNDSEINIVKEYIAPVPPSPIQSEESILPEGDFCDQISRLLNIWQSSPLPRIFWSCTLRGIVWMFSWITKINPYTTDEKIDFVFNQLDNEFPFLWKVIYPNNPPKSPNNLSDLFIAGCMDMAMNSYTGENVFYPEENEDNWNKSKKSGGSPKTPLKKNDIYDKLVYHILLSEFKYTAPFYLNCVYPILCTIAPDCVAPDIICVSEREKEEIVQHIVSMKECSQAEAWQFIQMKQNLIFEKTKIEIEFLKY